MSGPYDSHYAFNQGYDNQYQHQPQYQSAYPASGFAQSQPYQNDNHSSYPSDQGYNYNQYQQPQSYYQQAPPAINVQAPGDYTNTANDTDRGLLGAVAGGAAGAFAGHKTRGHGVLGALGGAILGSLTEDYAKKGKKSKQNKKSSRSNSTSTNISSSGSAMSGLGPVASSFFNQTSSKK